MLNFKYLFDIRGLSERIVKLLVFGSRSIDDEEFIFLVLSKIIGNRKDVIIIEGDAIGADKIAGKFADVNGLCKEVFMPEWDKFEKSAGVMRSEDMVKSCEKAIGFWDGTSKGTMHTVKFLVNYKKPCILFTREGKKWEKKYYR